MSGEASAATGAADQLDVGVDANDPDSLENAGKNKDAMGDKAKKSMQDKFDKEQKEHGDDGAQAKMKSDFAADDVEKATKDLEDQIEEIQPTGEGEEDEDPGKVNSTPVAPATSSSWIPGRSQPAPTIVQLDKREAEGKWMHWCRMHDIEVTDHCYPAQSPTESGIKSEEAQRRTKALQDDPRNENILKKDDPQFASMAANCACLLSWRKWVKAGRGRRAHRAVDAVIEQVRKDLLETLLNALAGAFAKLHSRDCGELNSDRVVKYSADGAGSVGELVLLNDPLLVSADAVIGDEERVVHRTARFAALEHAKTGLTKFEKKKDSLRKKLTDKEWISATRRDKVNEEDVFATAATELLTEAATVNAERANVAGVNTKPFVVASHLPIEFLSVGIETLSKLLKTTPKNFEHKLLERVQGLHVDTAEDGAYRTFWADGDQVVGWHYGTEKKLVDGSNGRPITPHKAEQLSKKRQELKETLEDVFAKDAGMKGAVSRFETGFGDHLANQFNRLWGLWSRGGVEFYGDKSGKLAAWKSVGSSDAIETAAGRTGRFQEMALTETLTKNFAADFRGFQARMQNSDLVQVMVGAKVENILNEFLDNVEKSILEESIEKKLWGIKSSNGAALSDEHVKSEFRPGQEERGRAAMQSQIAGAAQQGAGVNSGAAPTKPTAAKPLNNYPNQTALTSAARGLDKALVEHTRKFLRRLEQEVLLQYEGPILQLAKLGETLAKVLKPDGSKDGGNAQAGTQENGSLPARIQNKMLNGAKAIWAFIVSEYARLPEQLCIGGGLYENPVTSCKGLRPQGTQEDPLALELDELEKKIFELEAKVDTLTIEKKPFGNGQTAFANLGVDDTAVQAATSPTVPATESEKLERRFQTIATYFRRSQYLSLLDPQTSFLLPLFAEGFVSLLKADSEELEQKYTKLLEMLEQEEVKTGAQMAAHATQFRLNFFQHFSSLNLFQHFGMAEITEAGKLFPNKLAEFMSIGMKHHIQAAISRMEILPRRFVALRQRYLDNVVAPVRFRVLQSARMTKLDAPDSNEVVEWKKLKAEIPTEAGQSLTKSQQQKLLHFYNEVLGSASQNKYYFVVKDGAAAEWFDTRVNIIDEESGKPLFMAAEMLAKLQEQEAKFVKHKTAPLAGLASADSFPATLDLGDAGLRYYEHLKKDHVTAMKDPKSLLFHNAGANSFTKHASDAARDTNSVFAPASHNLPSSRFALSSKTDSLLGEFSGSFRNIGSFFGNLYHSGKLGLSTNTEKHQKTLASSVHDFKFLGKAIITKGKPQISAEQKQAIEKQDAAAAALPATAETPGAQAAREAGLPPGTNLGSEEEDTSNLLEAVSDLVSETSQRLTKYRSFFVWLLSNLDSAYSNATAGAGDFADGKTMSSMLGALDHAYHDTLDLARLGKSWFLLSNAVSEDPNVLQSFENDTKAPLEQNVPGQGSTHITRFNLFKKYYLEREIGDFFCAQEK